MGFQYNGKLRCTELLLREDGSVMQNRRAETIDDYFATLDFSKLLAVIERILTHLGLSAQPPLRAPARLERIFTRLTLLRASDRVPIGEKWRLK